MAVTLPSPEQLQVWISKLRQHRREQTLGLLATLLISGAALVSTDQLPQDFRSILARTHAASVLFSLALLLYGWLVVRLWRQGQPRRRDVIIRPDAIKGPRSFGPQDGELFLRLGRDRELGELLGCVLDDQIGLVVLMGESGAGKTSLLRSGLTHQLEKVQVPLIPCAYWEALPTDPEAGLLHAIQEKFQDPIPFTSVSLVSRLDEAHRVVLLDQLEQLDPVTPEHASVFDLLRQVGLRKPPFRTTWIVSFRREFDPAWRDFEISYPQLRNHVVSLKRFPQDRAKEVLATLAETVDLTLDNALLDDLVGSAADKTGVSPVDLGIAMLVLDELARSQRLSSLSLDNYRSAGGSEALLSTYLLDRLSYLTDEERRALLKALLLLVDLPNNQRVAEGRSLADLGVEASRPLPQMESDLDDLVEARLLERVGADHYRLQHERIIEPLRQLTGQLLADADRARMVLTDAFGRWLRHPRSNALLAGADLRLVLRHRTPLLVRQPDAAEFLRRSRGRRDWRRATAAAATGLLIVGALFSLRALRISNDRALLQGAGLPSELAYQQRQLRSLHLGSEGLGNLSWLHAPLTELEFSIESMKEFPPLPSTLVRLTLHGDKQSLIDDLQTLPQLEELTLVGSQPNNLSSIGRFRHLRKLHLIFAEEPHTKILAPLTSLPALEELHVVVLLPSRSTVSLPRLDRLKKLRLSSYVSNPESFPLQLEELDYNDGTLLNPFPFLPRLTRIKVDRNPNPSTQCPFGARVIPRLKALDLKDAIDPLPNLSCFSKLEDLRLRYRRLTIPISIPEPARPILTSLEIDCAPTVDSLLKSLPRLTSLMLRDGPYPCESLALPPSLERLDVEVQRPISLSFWDKLAHLPRLRELRLDLRLGKLVFSARDFPLLRVLTLDNAGPTSLTFLKNFPALKELHLTSYVLQGLPSLRGFPTLQELQVLDLEGAGAVDLGDLPPLPHLKTLNLGGVPIKSLDHLPPTVTELYL